MKKYYKIITLLFLFLTHNVHIVSANNKIPRKRTEKKIHNNNVIILFHLYNLDLMDEFIIKINNFITLNKSQNFYIKINVPVDSRINNFNTLDNNETVSPEQHNFFYTQCIESTPYHPELITYDNALPLYRISDYLKQQLKCDNEKIQVIFSENRGVDVGSFLLLLDQVIEQNIPHDYIVKIHTKTIKSWREKLLKILDCKIKTIALKYDACYACNKIYNHKNPDPIERNTMPLLKEVLDNFELPHNKSFGFSAGTMFIVSHKFTKFFKKYNRVELFNQLNYGYEGGIKLEHGYERFFGYLTDSIAKKTMFLTQYKNK